MRMMVSAIGTVIAFPIYLIMSHLITGADKARAGAKSAKHAALIEAGLSIATVAAICVLAGVFIMWEHGNA